MLEILFIGAIFGLPIFLFTLVLTKKNGKVYYAPLVTFIVAILVTAYGLFKVGGFEGMAYGILSVGILVVALVGVLLLPFISKRMTSNQLNKVDKAILVLSPLVLFAAIGWIISSNESYWIIDKGAIADTQFINSHYTVSTISEGSKQLHIQLDEKYVGKSIEVEKVKTVGNTEVTVKIVNGGEVDAMPYITIGLHAIVEPLKVQTTDGETISPHKENY